MEIYEISDDWFKQLAQGAKNIYAEKKSRYKTIEGWQKAGAKTNICVVVDEYTVREELRIPRSKIQMAYTRMTAGDGPES